MNDKTFNSFLRRLNALELEWCIINGDMVCYIDDTQYCPLTAMYFRKTGNYLPPGRATEAGRKLGYSTKNTEYIIRLADDHYDSELDDLRNFYSRVDELRKLIKHQPSF